MESQLLLRKTYNLTPQKQIRGKSRHKYEKSNNTNTKTADLQINNIFSSKYNNKTATTTQRKRQKTSTNNSTFLQPSLKGTFRSKTRKYPFRSPITEINPRKKSKTMAMATRSKTAAQKKANDKSRDKANDKAEKEIETENKQNELEPTSESAKAKSNHNLGINEILYQIGTSREKLADATGDEILRIMTLSEALPPKELAAIEGLLTGDQVRTWMKYQKRRNMQLMNAKQEQEQRKRMKLEETIKSLKEQMDHKEYDSNEVT